MLDLAKLDASLKLRALGRLLDSNHPTLKLLRNKINFDDFFFPKFVEKVDDFVSQGVKLLSQDRLKLLNNPRLSTDVKLLTAIRAIKIKNMIKPQFENNIVVFILARAGTRELGQLNPRELNELRRLLKDNIPFNLLQSANLLRLRGIDNNLIKGYYCKGTWKDLSKISSKELREARSTETPICVFKSGVLLNPIESSNWLKVVNSLSSTAHKNAILRYIHGDIYSRERQFRFGLSNDPHCESCGQLETIKHKIVDCDYASSLWQSVLDLIGPDTANPREPNFIVGSIEPSKAALTLHAELILNLTRNSRQPRLNPDEYIKKLIRNLIKKEKGVTKTDLENFIR